MAGTLAACIQPGCSTSAATPPPGVSLKVMAEDALVAPANVSLVAEISVSSGYVRWVEFFNGDQLLAKVEANPILSSPQRLFQWDWRTVLAGEYQLSARATDNAGTIAVSKTVSLAIKPSASAFLVIQKPAPESQFTSPATIPIEVIAVDPRADIRRVEFYANEKFIDRSEHLTKEAVIPGRPISHRFEWEDVGAGVYTITAKAVDFFQKPVGSPPVRITVKRVVEETWITVETGKSQATETGNLKERSLVFVITRKGPLSIELPVDYTLGGTAQNGVDYRKLDGRLVIPAGAVSAELTVEALPDSVTEADETVEVAIKPPACIEIYPPPPECYQVGDPSTAFGFIREATAPAPNQRVLVKQGSIWRYSNDGTDQKELWREPDFMDQSWSSGPAQLGYGDGDEATVTYKGDQPRPITAYFRHAFEVTDPGLFKHMVVRLVRDDGAAVYLNGKEIWRDNLPEGVLTSETRALASAGSDENAFHVHGMEAIGLIPGRNVIAVEVHQSSPSSSDLSFDLELAAFEQEQRPVVSLVATQPETMEPSPNTRVRPGAFLISRTGSSDQPLTIACLLGGTAILGKDYNLNPSPSLAFLWTIPAGKSSLELLAAPIDDNLVEGDETLSLELIALPAIVPGWDPYLLDARAARAKVVIHDNDPAPRISLNITSPKNGARFTRGEPVEIQATAIDPQGYINRLEFYDGDKRIGISELIFVRAPDPGTPIDHSFVWKDAPVGEHVLTVRVVHSSQGAVLSDPVTIQIDGGENRPVVLEVVATDPVASESPEASGKPDTATFVIKRRSGPIDLEVPVFFTLKGTAVQGRDYTGLDGVAFLKSGRESVELILTPVADNIKEGDETVILKLEPPICIAIYPPPPGCYQVGPQGEAKAVILDRTTSQPPHVVLDHPSDGAVFTLPATIPITAKASDPDGQVVRLDILIDNQVFGYDKENTLTVSWKNPTPGIHKIMARAVDDSGLEGFSPAIEIRVRSEDEVAFVHRNLPPAYVPGAAFTVELRVNPPSHGAAYAVEDQPPAGWEVSHISDQGVFDAVHGRIKFGPFTDRQSRTLTYHVLPPRNARDRYEFKGASSLDGKAYAIAGDSVIEPVGEIHPADRDPADKAISMTELTAYAAAWKEGQNWPAGPVPIPMGYLTRAGALWKGGESYLYDPTKGAPPRCWINPPVSRRLTASGVATGHARRFLPNRCLPGQTVDVTIKVECSTSTAAWAVEEIVPAGWIISDIGNDGRYDAAIGSIRWGLFYGKQPHVLSYRVTAPDEVTSEVSFKGLVSFDGVEYAIEGNGGVVATDSRSGLRFKSIGRHANGHMRLQVAGPPNQLFAVEASSDLVHWFELDTRLLTTGEFEMEDDDAATANIRYYRLRPIGK